MPVFLKELRLWNNNFSWVCFTEYYIYGTHQKGKEYNHFTFLLHYILSFAIFSFFKALGEVSQVAHPCGEDRQDWLHSWIKWLLRGLGELNNLSWVSGCVIINAGCKRYSRSTAFGSGMFSHWLQRAKKLSLQAGLKNYCYHSDPSTIKANKLKLNHVKFKIGTLILEWDLHYLLLSTGHWVPRLSAWNVWWLYMNGWLNWKEQSVRQLVLWRVTHLIVQGVLSSLLR